jgi:hypothetical protein
MQITVTILMTIMMMELCTLYTIYIKNAICAKRVILIAVVNERTVIYIGSL